MGSGALSLALSIIYYKKPFYSQAKYALFFIFGLLWCALHVSTIIQSRLPKAIENTEVKVIGIVDSIPVLHDAGVQFEFKIQQTVPNAVWPNPGRVLLYLRNSTNLFKVGEQWQFCVKLKKPHAYSNPGSYDIEKHFFQHKIIAKGYVLVEKPYSKMGSGDNNPKTWIQNFRIYLKKNIDHILQGKHFKGVINALVVGVQEGISATQWETFRQTGTNHLVAISGLHIGLVASFLFILVKKAYGALPLRFLKVPSLVIGAYGAINAAIFYAFIAGFSIPTRRAIIMITLFMVSTIKRRLVSKSRIFFISLGLTILFDPISVLSAGFWLSFGAVGILLYGMQGRLRPSGIWYKWIRAQWVVFLGLMPLMFAIFDKISLVSPITNIVAIPWVSFLVVPLSLVGALCTIFSTTLAGIILNLAHQTFSLINTFLEFTRTMPMATLANATHSMLSISCAIIGVGILLLPRGVKGKQIAVVWLLPLLMAHPVRVEKNMANITILDVGQGFAAVVETQNHVLVFDTGPKVSPQFDTGEQVVVPFLATRGLKKIDRLVISHNDNDHIGGAHFIVQHMAVETIMMSRQDGFFKNKTVIECRAGDRWGWDGVLFEILHPSTYLDKKNDFACVLKVTAGEQSVLLTADIEAKSEALLLQKNPLALASTILVVPHHGSKTSSTLPFIQAVNPQYAIIPCGYLNTYGHPKEEIVQRYRQQGIVLLNTVEDGAVFFMLGKAGKLERPRSYRLENKHYWNE